MHTPAHRTVTATNLQAARNHLAGSIASVKPSEPARMNAGGDLPTKVGDGNGRIRGAADSTDSRLPVGEVLRRIRMNEQRPLYADGINRAPGSPKVTSSNGSSRNELFFDSSSLPERKLLTQMRELKDRRPAKNEMETALHFRNSHNDQDIDDEVRIFSFLKKSNACHDDC